jgi:hypothetical protein
MTIQRQLQLEDIILDSLFASTFDSEGLPAHPPETPPSNAGPYVNFAPHTSLTSSAGLRMIGRPMAQSAVQTTSVPVPNVALTREPAVWPGRRFVLSLVLPTLSFAIIYLLLRSH